MLSLQHIIYIHYISTSHTLSVHRLTVSCGSGPHTVRETNRRHKS